MLAGFLISMVWFLSLIGIPMFAVGVVAVWASEQRVRSKMAFTCPFVLILAAFWGLMCTNGLRF